MKSCQTQTKIVNFDFAIVIEHQIKSTSHYDKVVKYFQNLQMYGVQLELSYGMSSDNVYVKLHLPEDTAQFLLSVFDFSIDNQGHQYLPTRDFFSFKIFQTPLSSHRDLFIRKKKALTKTERLLLLHEIMFETKYGTAPHQFSLARMLNQKFIKDAYPLHDGPAYYDSKALNERQVLFKYWATFNMWYKEQPLNLIEKYYGAQVAFYFAYFGFYNKMLILPAILGVVCFLYGVYNISTKNDENLKEICTSNFIMCPSCSFGNKCKIHLLKENCFYAKIAAIFNNSAIFLYAMFMSFWATIYVYVWIRYENILKIRWNTSSVIKKAKILPEFIKKSSWKTSEWSKNKFYYMPLKKRIFYNTVTYSVCFFLLLIFMVYIFGIIMYRAALNFVLHGKLSPNVTKYHTIIEAITAAGVQVIFIKFFQKFYIPASQWLTEMETPRTQEDFDNAMIYKRFFLGFITNYLVFFYMAFIKGRSYRPSQETTSAISHAHQCHPSGCIIDVSVQLFVVMICKQMIGNILITVVTKIRYIFGKKIDRIHEAQYGQHEVDFRLKSTQRYFLATDFMELFIQFGFVFFFVGAFPLAPMCALIINCMELRIQAYRLVTQNRRPVPRVRQGIAAWNKILWMMSLLSVATNPFVVAFGSDIIPAALHYITRGTLQGFMESTFSIYDLRDSYAQNNNLLEEILKRFNTTYCYYKDSRYPPDHPRKYQRNETFWYDMTVRLIFVAIFEHIVMAAKGIIKYLLPDVPKDVEEFLQKKQQRKSKKL